MIYTVRRILDMCSLAFRAFTRCMEFSSVLKDKTAIEAHRGRHLKTRRRAGALLDVFEMMQYIFHGKAYFGREFLQSNGAFG